MNVFLLHFSVTVLWTHCFGWLKNKQTKKKEKNHTISINWTDTNDSLTAEHKQQPIPTDPQSLHLHSHQLDHSGAEDWCHLRAAGVVTTVTAMCVERGVSCHAQSSHPSQQNGDQHVDQRLPAQSMTTPYQSVTLYLTSSQPWRSYQGKT